MSRNQEIIWSLNYNKATGADRIPTKIVKLSANVIKQSFMQYYQQ